MTPRDISALLQRDLNTFSTLLDRYSEEALLWRDSPVAPNSTGTLALHVAGNLRHFVGAVLGKTGYVRDRAGEFSRRDVPRNELKTELAAASSEVAAALNGMPPESLAGEYPMELPVGRIRTGLFLLHLTTHLSYHLGQADGHRRWVAKDGAPIGAVPIPSETAGG